MILPRSFLPAEREAGSPLHANGSRRATVRAVMKGLAVYESPFHKPDFNSADDYVEYVRDGIRLGKLSFGPTTADELIAVFEALPEYTRQQGWMPYREQLEEMFGLPADYFDPIEPLTEREQERLLVTLANDDDFRAAFRTLLMGGPAA